MMNDVWKSSNSGVSWTQIGTGTTAAGTFFSPTYLHSGVKDSFDNFYIIGGYNSKGLSNEVWKSTNKGLTWLRVDKGTTATSSLFSGRYWHASVIDSNDRIWVTIYKFI